MGIQGLLPLLKSIQKPTHLRNFAGQTLGVDAYGWLHRGTVACAIELAQQKPTRKHIEFTLNRVRMLIDFGVKPFLVFDGDYLPSKSHTEKDRAARRRESKKTGLELLQMGRISQAHLELQKAVDVTPLMARELIEELKRMDVPYIVAPYEADSQLAYLEKQGIIDGVLSEDSDLLVFGVKCLLTKLDAYGECIMINRADFTACREISLVGWTDAEFRMMAMLSGCDYLPGIDKLGLKTAYRLVRKHKTLERVVRTVQFDGKKKVPAGYIDSFTRAERTFLHQWVFCPEAKGLVNLNKVPADVDVADMPYIGKRVEPDVATGVAAGDLDPNTKELLPVPSRRPATLHRASTISTPSEKQGVPISEFFKPRRTPLAELDPNSFTPSPSQQRLLEQQQTTSWSASRIADMRPPAVRRLTTDAAPSTAPQGNRRSTSSPWPGTQRPSPKRQRLCADGMLTASMSAASGLETASSRFFSKQTTQPSPSIRKSSTQKKQDDFELWSDDSVAEVAAAIADSQESKAATTPKKRKKLAVFADTTITATCTQSAEVSQSTADSQESARTTLSTVSLPTADVETPATSFESDSAEESVFTKSINTEFAAMKKWAFQPIAHKAGVSRTNTAPAKCPTTPVAKKEKMKLDTAQTVDVPNIHSNREVEVPGSSPLTGGGDQCDILEDDERLALERRELNTVPELDVKGSEDLIVPNSPDDASEDERSHPRLDLGRFAFIG